MAEALSGGAAKTGDSDTDEYDNDDYSAGQYSHTLVSLLERTEEIEGCLLKNIERGSLITGRVYALIFSKYSKATKKKRWTCFDYLQVNQQ